MKPESLFRRIWNWPPPQNWTEVFAIIVALLVGFLVAVFTFAWLTGRLA